MLPLHQDGEEDEEEEDKSVWVSSDGTPRPVEQLSISLSNELGADTPIGKIVSKAATKSPLPALTAVVSSLLVNASQAGAHAYLCGASAAAIPDGDKWTRGMLVKGLENTVNVSFLILTGTPGIGKTSVIRCAAAPCSTGCACAR